MVCEREKTKSAIVLTKGIHIERQLAVHVCGTNSSVNDIHTQVTILSCEPIDNCHTRRAAAG